MARAPRLELLLGEHHEGVRAQVEAWQAEGFAERLRAHDSTLWSSEPVPELADRLGWLELPYVTEDTLGDWTGFAAAERASGIERVVVLGMGGSSLAPEMFGRVFGDGEFLRVLDSTHPDAVRRLAAELDRDRTLFVVSSKSGSTIETRSLFEFFWQWTGAEERDAGRHFITITDPGSELERLAVARRLHRVFLAPADVGGRYSALSAFGLVPAALAGVDIRRLVDRARLASEWLADGERSGILLGLGAAMGLLARSGIDKLTIVTSPEWASFADWLEQLVAESTGKMGQGLVPVTHSPLLSAGSYGEDRFFLGLLGASEGDYETEEHLRLLADQGHPVALIRLADSYDLGFEFLRWEIAVALAGVILEINPFDQPDVQLAKKMAAVALAGEGAMAPEDAVSTLVGPSQAATILPEWLPDGPPAYLALQAYLAPSPETDRGLARLAVVLRRLSNCAVTVGYGPRFLHSTGQLHKGGPVGGRFLQLTADDGDELGIPGEAIGFGQLVRAQADGDAAALHQRDREVCRIHLSESGELSSLITELEASR